MATSTIFRRPNLVEVTDWAEGLTFSRLKCYQHSGILYRCLTTHVAGPAFDGSKFEALSGISEAEIDGKQYVRKDGAWTEIVIPPADQVSLAVTANSKGVTAGNVVELVSDGVQNVQNIYHCEAPTIGSLLTLDGTNNIGNISLSRATPTEAFCVYDDGIGSYRANVSMIASGNPPALRGTLSLTTSNVERYIVSASTSNAALLLGCPDVGTNAYLSIITDNGGTNAITQSAKANFAMLGVSSGKVADICALTSSNWFVAYADANSDCQIRTAVSNGTNAPTLGTALNVNGTNNANYLSLARTSDTTAMLVFQDTSGSNGEIAHITGGTTNAPTASTLAHLDGTNNCTYITQSPIDSNHTLCAYNNTTTSNGCLAVIQANGTNAPTVISRSTFAFSAVAYCALSSHSANLHSLVYTDSNSDGQHLAVYVDSNYTLTWSQQAALNGTTNCAYNAVAALSPTTAIGAWQEGAGSDGKAATLTLTPTPVISGQLLGIAETTATSAAATVAIGPVWETTNTLSVGADYYVAAAGGISTALSTVHVGKADTANSLVLDLRGAPASGKVQVWEITTPGAFTFTVPEDGEYEIVLVGGGGSGSANATAACPGNGGNAIITIKSLKRLDSISGTIGAGGASSSSGNGKDGGASSISSPFLANASGGLGGTAGGSASSYAPNRPNRKTSGEIVGTTGTKLDGVFYGGTSLLGGDPVSSSSSIAALPGFRGNGGLVYSGGAGDSGKGGDGCLRITLTHGSGK